MVDTFMSKGFTYFDTAYVYIGGKSEVALKEAVVDRYPRDSFQCATKLPLWDQKSIEELEAIFQESLDRAGLEYYDFYLLHAMSAEREKKADELGAWDFMKRLKAEGKAKHLSLIHIFLCQSPPGSTPAEKASCFMGKDPFLQI